MLYAKVVLGLPVEGPFDYIVPQHLIRKVKVGTRVRVSFGTRSMVGYVVGLTHKTKIKSLKPILESLDTSAVLDKNLLLLTKELSDYYCCSWGEAIETAIPEGLRKGKPLPCLKDAPYTKAKGTPEVTLIQDLSSGRRWEIYLKAVKEALANHKAVIILLPNIPCLFKAKEKIAASLGIEPALLYRKQPKEIEEWFKIKRGEVDVVLGTRAAVFAPLKNLGLIIIDEEEGFVYKQDQVPHYHAREVALMRVNIQKAKLILGSTTPSLESFYAAREGRIKYVLLPKNKNFPEIKIVGTSRRQRKGEQDMLSSYAMDAISSSLNTQAKTLLFLNRKGFATLASCHNCGVALKCPRCNINLVYHFKDNILSCHYCNFRIPPPNICPECNGGYIKYSGIGTEKIESEVARIFPQARIKREDELKELDLKDTDIIISTQHIIKETGLNFDLITVVSIDNSLNRIDFRAAEKTFGLLVGLWGLTDKKLIIQTGLPKHHCFRALDNKDVNIFYDEELKERKQLKFPPYRHLGLVKLRGENETKVKEASERLFRKLCQENPDKAVKVMSVNPAHPLKLRGNFYWQILLSSASPKKISRFLKISLKDFSHSGIIVTVDIDPI